MSEDIIVPFVINILIWTCVFFRAKFSSNTSVNNSILPAEINENSVTYTVVFADAYRKHINAKSNVSKLVVFCV